MTLEPAASPATAGLIARIQNILLKPKMEWDAIDAETTTVSKLFQGYAVPLAAIGPVCTAVGAIVFGYGGFGFSFRPSPISVIANALVSYVLSLVSVFVLALIIDALAPNFGGTKNRLQAMKVAIYGSTASWLAGVFFIMPMLSILSILGLYSLYLIYLGLPRLMKTPQEKAMPYTAVVMVVAIVLAIVVAAVLTPLRMMGAGLGVAGMAAPAAAGGQFSVNGTTVDVAKLQAASAQLQAQSATLQAQVAASSAGVAGAQAPAGAVSPDALKAVLPTELNGFARTSITGESMGAQGVGATTAEAEYEKGPAHMKLSVSSMGALGALSSLAGAVGVNTSKETATGYEKVTSANGRTTTETYDRTARSGSLSVMSQGFVVSADGDGVAIEDLRAAVAAVGPDRLTSLARR